MDHDTPLANVEGGAAQEAASSSVAIHSVQLSNFLSFGPVQQAVPLRSLNILIGPNGCGKSNLIDAFALLRSAPGTTPRTLVEVVLEGGGRVSDWLYRGVGADAAAASAAIEVVLEVPSGSTQRLRYRLEFAELAQRFVLADERIEDESPMAGESEPCFYYRYNRGRPVLNARDGERNLRGEDVDWELSILAQRRDPHQYPELTHLGWVLGHIHLYRDWRFGRNTPLRWPQSVALPNHRLESDGSNLALVLNRLASNPGAKRQLLEALRELYDGIDDYHVEIEGGTVQLVLFEAGRRVPATRLSDGTLRYLCLLAVLCHPDPGAVVCIEEPELGLHPDVLPTVAALIQRASERTQLIVTTHSDVLVDAMSEQPESVLVAEKTGEGTCLRRLDGATLQPWLEKYRLGQLWTRGDIGGTRW